MVKEGELTQVRHLGITIQLPNIDGVKHLARVNWIQDFGEGFFKTGIEFCDAYPYDWGAAIWALKLDKEKREFIPLFNAMME